MNPFKPKPIHSLLGLSLHGRQVWALVMQSDTGQPKVVAKAHTTLSLDPLTNDPELVAQELKAFLDTHELRETKCLVCLPSNLVLASSIDIPDLSDEDRQSYLDLQAETEFPFGPGDANMASLFYQAPDQSQHATLAAVPRSQVARLENILTLAKLRPVSFTLGISELVPSGSPDPGAPHLFLGVYADHVDLCVKCQDGFAAVRSLDEVFEEDGGRLTLDQDLLTRELKITLGQLSGGIRPALKQATISLHGDLPGSIPEQIKTSLQTCGLTATSSPQDGGSLYFATQAFLARQGSKLQFLPPKENQFEAFAKKISSRGNAWIGGTVGTIVILTALVFYIQSYRLQSLEKQWAGMADKVDKLETMQGKIRQFRPWFDRSAQSLEITKQLSEAFPREGTIWVKSVQIKENNQVFCSGSARNNQELLSVMDALREMEDISDVKLQQVRGEAPVQFAFNFNWKSGGQ